jgi:outer membrane protein assembly factor BamB
MYRATILGTLLLAIVAADGCAEPPSNAAARPDRPVQGATVEKVGAARSTATKPTQAGDAAIASGEKDWPGFLGPNRNGKSPEHGLPSEFPATGPPVVWQVPVGTGYSAPAISNGRLFHFARYGDNERLTCLNAQTGKPIWTHEYLSSYEDMLGYNNGPRATPVVDGENVYTFGAEGMLQCVRVADGEPVWRVDTTKNFHVVKNFFGVGSTPLVWGDLLLVNVGGSPPDGPPDVYAAQGRVESDGAAIVAFDKLTGKVRWKTGEDLASYASPVVAKIDGRDIVFMFARGGLMAIDPAQGETIAQFPWRARLLESVNASSPVIVGDEVFISETYELGSALLLVDDTLVCLSEDGTLRLIRAHPDRYEELARWELKSADGTPLLGYPAWAAPALADGLLYIQGGDRLLCLNLIDGR